MEAQTDSTMTSMDDFIAELGLTMRCKPTRHNPHMSDSRHPMDHWHCTIMDAEGLAEYEAESDPSYRLEAQYKMQATDDSHRMDLVFSMGMAHTGEPELADVLNCLASDAGSVENFQSFEDWCADLGYDEDSRKAEAIFKACEDQTDDLRQVLGETAMQTLMYDVERL